MKYTVLALSVIVLAFTSTVTVAEEINQQGYSPIEPDLVIKAEVIVVGAGISGLSAAVELGRAGVNVLVVDMNSVPGGHAVMAFGIAIAGTPLQERVGINDNPDLAYKDWMAWAGGGHPMWTRFYADNSREMIYDWISEMGAEWAGVEAFGDENSVARYHFTEQGALGVVQALWRTALMLPNVRFIWNQRVEHLVVEDSRVTGAEVMNLRSSEIQILHGEHVVLATGGFEGDLDRVLAHWPPDMPRPARLLIGASPHARGQGLDLAEAAGANLSNLDRHFIYFDGTVDVRDPQGKFSVTVHNSHSMWVNNAGQRFTNESGINKTIIADLLDQEVASYWAIFDELGREATSMLGVEWIHNKMDRHPILDDPAITKKAMTLLQLAELTDLPAEALATSVQRYNGMIDTGEDSDFTRFGKLDDVPLKIVRPPFYAIQFFPTTRKSMGGVTVDMQTRALDNMGNVVPGLYAIGELTGSVGINGKHGMAGMFLGPGIVTGRVAGQAITTALADRQVNVSEQEVAQHEDHIPESGKWKPALTVDSLTAMLAEPRDGYWHFQRSHNMVLEQQFECGKCHSAEVPFFPVNNHLSKLAQSQVCSNCHGRW